MVRQVLREEEQVLCFRRGEAICIVNFGDEPVAIPAGTVMLTSEPLTADGRLLGPGAAWVAAG